MTEPTTEELVERDPIDHELKTWPEPFQAMKSGAKCLEFRKDDRDYRVGDSLFLREWYADTGYTGDSLRRRVTHCLRGGFGVPAGYVAMSVSDEQVSQRLSDLEGKLGEARKLLTEVQSACLYPEDDGEIGVTEEPTIDGDLFDRISAALKLTASDGGEDNSLSQGAADAASSGRPEAPRSLDEAWAAVNVLGAPDTACRTDEDRAYCRAIGDALAEIEKLGGRPN